MTPASSYGKGASLRFLLAAIIIPLVACALQWLLWPLIHPYVWFFFFPAVFLSSWVGSLPAGIASTILSASLVAWFFISPTHTFLKGDPSSYLTVAMFVGMGLLFGFTHESLRRANQRAAKALETSREANSRLLGANEQISRLYEKTKELDELKTQFFANVSHELRTPLTLILGPTERLLSETSFTLSQRESLALIEKNARGLLEQVNALLDVAKLEAGKMSVVYSDLDLAELVRQTASNFETLAQGRGLTFIVQASDTLPAQVDVDKVRRILLNLLSNAFKFTPPGGRITCSLEPLPEDPAKALLRVTDTGPGIPPELTEKIFERFFQEKGGATRRFEGTGLGLSIAKEFVELQGGHISASNAPTGGAIFTIELPLKAPSGSTLRPAPALEPALPEVPTLPKASMVVEAPPLKDARPLVLVVEDNPDMNRFIVEALATDFRTASAFDGQVGFDQVLSLNPDLLICDLMMPKMSGDQLVRAIRLRTELDRLPIIILSAKADEALRVRLLREGAQDYLMKPFEEEELRARARNLAIRKRAEEALLESEARFRSIIELAPDAVLMLDEGDRIILANAHASDVFGFTRNELLGNSAKMLIPALEKDQHLDRCRPLSSAPGDSLLGALGTALQLMARRKDNVEFPVEVALSPFITNAGFQVIAIIRDISERKRILGELARRETELKQSEEMAQLKDHLLSTLSHELKTPLTLIAGYAELLQDKYENDELIAGILDGTWRLSSHLSNLLDYHALLTDSLPLYKGEIDLAETLAEAIEVEKRSFKLNHLNLVTDLPAHAPLILADSRRVTQMVTELLENAKKFTPSGGTVTVRITSNEHQARIMVDDTGPGIDQEDFTSIWQAFTQLNMGDAIRKGGLGLGLAIVKALAELHGGYVELESTLGKGTRFTICMPTLTG